MRLKRGHHWPPPSAGRPDAKRVRASHSSCSGGDRDALLTPGGRQEGRNKLKTEMVTCKLNLLQGLQGRECMEPVASGLELPLQPQLVWGGGTGASMGGGPTPPPGAVTHAWMQTGQTGGSGDPAWGL